ncbi:MAG: class I SAM-dependent methyltransferase [Thioploca sp.]|nr:class I SAM-dependent methyltransferase [Thioploca sp.]
MITENSSNSNQNYLCWVCGSTRQFILRESIRGIPLSSSMFRITDAHYGQTGSIYQCQECGFRQCNGLEQVLNFYEQLEDKDYEASRAERAIQARRILQTVSVYRPSGRLLDIGAGSGILVEEAQKLGYIAQGIEPSKWLCDKAIERELSVHHGTLPHMNINPPYDVITLIDVIEHVSNPMELLRNIHQLMTKESIGIVVTPDVGSLTARLMGYRWWHYRIAHIGYFNQKTLNLALVNANLRLLFVLRPKWYFSMPYLIKRINIYLPRLFHLPVFKWMEHITIPLNLFDSILVVFTKE